MSKMSKLFDQDNMFFAIMGVLFDLIILNVLTLLCCMRGFFIYMIPLLVLMGATLPQYCCA